jgi:hypothetical protein
MSRGLKSGVYVQNSGAEASSVKGYAKQPMNYICRKIREKYRDYSHKG